MKCLILREQINSVNMVERTSTSISLELPEPSIQDCSDESSRFSVASVKNILYYGQVSNRGNSHCNPFNTTTCESMVNIFKLFDLLLYVISVC